MKLRPPKLYKYKNQRYAIMGGSLYPIYSNLGDNKLMNIIQGGYNKDEDDEFLEQKDEYEDYEPEEDYAPLSHRGLYDDEMNYIAEQLGLFKNGYLGAFPIDKIHLIADLIKPGIKKFGFIFNTDPSNKPGKHWISCCYISKNKEFDYYNSVGEGPTDEFLQEIKPVIDKLALPYYLKFKVNAIPRQGASFNCGYHSLLFLYKMLVLGEEYKFASGYSNIRKGENEIKDFKQKLKKFGYI